MTKINEAPMENDAARLAELNAKAAEQKRGLDAIKKLGLAIGRKNNISDEELVKMELLDPSEVTAAEPVVIATPVTSTPEPVTPVVTPDPIVGDGTLAAGTVVDFDLTSGTHSISTPGSLDPTLEPAISTPEPVITTPESTDGDAEELIEKTIAELEAEVATTRNTYLSKFGEHKRYNSIKNNLANLFGKGEKDTTRDASKLVAKKWDTEYAKDAYDDARIALNEKRYTELKDILIARGATPEQMDRALGDLNGEIVKEATAEIKLMNDKRAEAMGTKTAEFCKNTYNGFISGLTEGPMASLGKAYKWMGEKGPGKTIYSEDGAELANRSVELAKQAETEPDETIKAGLIAESKKLENEAREKLIYKYRLGQSARAALLIVGGASIAAAFTGSAVTLTGTLVAVKIGRSFLTGIGGAFAMHGNNRMFTKRMEKLESEKEKIRNNTKNTTNKVDILAFERSIQKIEVQEKRAKNLKKGINIFITAGMIEASFAGGSGHIGSFDTHLGFNLDKLADDSIFGSADHVSNVADLANSGVHTTDSIQQPQANVAQDSIKVSPNEMQAPVYNSFGEKAQAWFHKVGQYFSPTDKYSMHAPNIDTTDTLSADSNTGVKVDSNAVDTTNLNKPNIANNIDSTHVNKVDSSAVDSNKVKINIKTNPADTNAVKDTADNKIKYNVKTNPADTNTTDTTANKAVIDKAAVVATEAPEKTEAPATEFKTFKVDVSDKGALQTIKDLKHTLAEQFKGVDAKDIPTNVKHILDTDHVTLTKEFGLYDPKAVNESAMVLKGSALEFKDGNVVLHNLGKGDTILSSMKAEEVEKYHGKMFHYAPKVAVDTKVKADALDKTSAPKVKVANDAHVDPTKPGYAVKSKVVVEKIERNNNPLIEESKLKISPEEAKIAAGNNVPKEAPATATNTPKPSATPEADNAKANTEKPQEVVDNRPKVRVGGRYDNTLLSDKDVNAIESIRGTSYVPQDTGGNTPDMNKILNDVYPASTHTGVPTDQNMPRQTGQVRVTDGRTPGYNNGNSEPTNTNTENHNENTNQNTNTNTADQKPEAPEQTPEQIAHVVEIQKQNFNEGVDAIFGEGSGDKHQYGIFTKEWDEMKHIPMNELLTKTKFLHPEWNENIKQLQHIVTMSGVDYSISPEDGGGYLDCEKVLEKLEMAGKTPGESMVKMWLNMKYE